LDRDRIQELHYITDWKNIPSILAHGILSHRAAERVAHESVADEEVQARRAEVRIPGGRPLHHYACLYFDARNVMLYRLIQQGQLRLAVLAVDPAVIDSEEVVVSDRNAASGTAVFRPAAAGVRELDEAMVYAEWWNESRDARQRRCAEVLVPERIHSATIRKAYVANDDAATRLRADVPDVPLPVEVNGHLFFEGPRP
jgi:hypothetical protein